MTKCPLCRAIREEADEVFITAYDGSMSFQILRTKDMKQHYHRYMIVANEHVSKVSDYEEWTAKAALFKWMLEKVSKGKNRSSNQYPFVIMEPDHATIKNHWHIVASDCQGEDFQQIENTTRLAVIKLRPGESWQIVEAEDKPAKLMAFKP